MVRCNHSDLGSHLILPYQFCDIKQVISPLEASVFPSAKWEQSPSPHKGGAKISCDHMGRAPRHVANTQQISMK